MLLKLGIMGLIVMASFVLALARMQPLFWVVLLGLMFSWMGDASLADFPPVVNIFKPAAYWGMGFFAAAQICYTVALAMFISGTPGRGPAWIIAGYIAAGMLLWWLLAGRGQADARLKIASIVYAACLVIMAGTACAAAFHQSRVIWPLFLGGLIFLVSDGLIGLGWFRGVQPGWLGVAIWSTYVPAQLLLLAGFWLMPTARAAVTLSS